jgi:hypothetical protein
MHATLSQIQALTPVVDRVHHVSFLDQAAPERFCQGTIVFNYQEAHGHPSFHLPKLSFDAILNYDVSVCSSAHARTKTFQRQT